MKTILITGSTDGIGKLAAIKLAADGHHVLLHGRNSDKLENVVAEIKSITNNDKIESFTSDFSSLESIHLMIEKVLEEVPKIDVLINNAGVFKSKNTNNDQGLDLRFMVNYIAPYALTKGLLSLIKKGKSPRVINLSSAAQARVSIRALLGKEPLSEQEAYAQSKLALTMWSFAFANANPLLTTIALNPGSLLNTKMVQEAYGQFWSAADKGADIIYDLTVKKEFDKSNGQYFDNDKGSFNKAHEDAYDQERIKILISETEKILSI